MVSPPGLAERFQLLEGVPLLACSRLSRVHTVAGGRFQSTVDPLVHTRSAEGLANGVLPK